MKIKIFLFCCIAVVLASCSSNKRSLAYMTNIDSMESSIAVPGDFAVKIQPDDELIITVTSAVPEATALYNMPLANTATRKDTEVQMNSTTIQSYIVDSKGEIELPVLGRLNVVGLTTRELSEKISAEVAKSVKDPHVRVELLTFRVNVLGEVNTPGAINVRKERYTILDAIADAHDLTRYGMRDNVLLIREEGGQLTYHRIDLTDASLLSSPYYYLRQNDVVYVEPNKIVTDNSRYNQYNGYKLSVMSTIISSVSVIVSLIIALTR